MKLILWGVPFNWFYIGIWSYKKYIFFPIVMCVCGEYEPNVKGSERRTFLKTKKHIYYGMAGCSCN